jgi:hypothetical protein
MRRFLFVCLSAVACAGGADAADWQVQKINAPARVAAVETVGGQVQVNAGGLWYEVSIAGDKATLKFIDSPRKPQLPEGALPDSKVATGKHDIARAWLAAPTTRYDHGILGDKTEAGSLVIETADGKRQEVKLDDDAVFEDLQPRIADLEGNGRDAVIVVKSYLKRGSALAVIAERRGRYQIVAETPPLGAAHRWLAPAGIADFIGDGKLDIALVRQPHAVGTLELWNFNGNALHKIAEMPDVANHIAGSRALDMAAAADFDGDGVADLALPSLDRKTLRFIAFVPQPREITNLLLPAPAQTNIGLMRNGDMTVLALGLADGSLVVIRKAAQ